MLFTATTAAGTAAALIKLAAVLSTAVLMSDSPDGKSFSPNIASACSGVKLSAQSPIGLAVIVDLSIVTAPLFSI